MTLVKAIDAATWAALPEMDVAEGDDLMAQAGIGADTYRTIRSDAASATVATLDAGSISPASPTEGSVDFSLTGGNIPTGATYSWLVNGVEQSTAAAPTLAVVETDTVDCTVTAGAQTDSAAQVTVGAAVTTQANTYIPDGSVPYTRPWVSDASTVTFNAGPPAADHFATVAGDARRMWMLPTIDGTDLTAVEDIEVLFKMQAVSGGADFRALVAVSGAATTETGLGLGWEPTQKRYIRYFNGAFSDTQISTVAAPAIAYIRVRYQGDNVYLKGWDAAGAEPAAWDLGPSLLESRPAGGVGILTNNGDTTTALLGMSFSTAADLDANPAPSF